MFIVLHLEGDIYVFENSSIFYLIYILGTIGLFTGLRSPSKILLYYLKKIPELLVRVHR